MCDELAELNVATMAGAGKSVIGLAAEEAGFARSFVDFQVGPYLPELLANGTKILANAGGPNPGACASHLAEFARGLGLRLRIVHVEGDKGDLATLAVIARQRSYVPWIGAALSAEAVAG